MIRDCLGIRFSKKRGCLLFSVLLGLIGLLVEAHAQALEDLSGVDVIPDSRTQALPEITITAESPSLLRSGVFDRDRLLESPARSLDGILRSIPGFTLYRRSDSLSAHPTAQGASLGNTGPNGASRVSVLKDGVPVNDPFGGWIPWSRFSSTALAGVSLTPNARPGIGATGPFCGSISVQTRFLDGTPFVSLESAAGDRLRLQFSGAFAEDLDRGKTRLFGEVSQTDFSGYPVIRSDQRGAVDEKVWMRASGFEFGAREFLAESRDWSLTLRGGAWREERGNGTPLGNNQAEAEDFSVQLEHRPLGGDWSGQWTVFHQRRDFGSTFTAVAADRSSESLSLDQYSVPATASGLFQRFRFSLGEFNVLSLGSDVRWTEGVTQEHYRNLGAGFTRGREAGGSQWDGGISLSDTWTPNAEWSVTPGFRVGAHQDADGHLREWDLATGGVVTNRRDPTRWSVPVDLGVSVRWTPIKSLDWEGAIYSNHREPTLNELYRPFRVGSTLTLANSSLRSEELRGLETGLVWRALDTLTLRGRFFWNELRHAVANVSEVAGPGVFGEWGSLPAGGIGARRENLERIEILGGEVGVEWKILDGLKADLRWLHSDAVVKRARIQRSLEGRVPAQMPTDTLVVGLRGTSTDWRWSFGGRWVSAQFDDDQNTRRLGQYVCFDIMLARKLWKECEVYVGVENLANTEIQSRRDPDGTIGVTSPRSCLGGVRLEF